jgi:hypothetical protein
VKRKVLLELPVGVLVVGRVVVPAEARDRLRDLRDEVEVAGQRAHVVAGELERVERVGDLELAVAVAPQQEVLELGADLRLVPECRRALQLVPEDRARAVRPLLPLDRHIAGKARHVRLPRQHRQRARIRDRDHVRVVRPLADVAGRKAREPGPFAQQVVEVVGRHELGARFRVHVDELREQELDPFVRDGSPYVVGILG